LLSSPKKWPFEVKLKKKANFYFNFIGACLFVYFALNNLSRLFSCFATLLLFSESFSLALGRFGRGG